MHYRVYWLDTDDHIRGAGNIDCSSDEQARRLAAVWLEAWPSVEDWRERAEEARVIADTMYDPDAKRAMEQAAESAERIAQSLDQRQRPSLPA